MGFFFLLVLHLYSSLEYLLTCMVSERKKKVLQNFYSCSSIGKTFFSSDIFQDFLYLFFWTLKMTPLCAVLFGIYTTCFSLSFLYLWFDIFINFRNLLAVTITNLSSAFFSFLIWHSNYAYLTPFKIILEVLDVLFCFVLYFLYISVKDVSVDASLSWLTLSCVESTSESIEDIVFFISVTVILISCLYFYFFWEFSSLCLYYLSILHVFYYVSY